MEIFHFVQHYQKYLAEIREVTKPEFHYILAELEDIDPHDLVRPDTWFPSESAARGFVWTMFVNRIGRLTLLE